MTARVIYLLIILGAVLWLPSWLAIILGVVGVIRYHNFYEILLPTLCFDFLYSSAGVTPVGFPLMFSFFSVAAVYLLEDLKSIILISRLS